MDFDYNRNEDEYFLKQDAAKRAKLRAELEAKASRAHPGGKLAEALGVEEGQIVERARELGFDEETAPVLHLVPLVHVAWADGSVSARERVTILRAAEAHGVAPGSAASTFLAALLEERPSAAWLDQTHDLLRAIAKRRGSDAHDIIALCRDVASASGGLLGLIGKVSDEEARLIREFADSLQAESDREVKSIVA